jgi:hypothetical protein
VRTKRSGDRVRLRRPHWRLDDLDAFAGEDGVEVAGELAVAVTDHEPHAAHRFVVQVHEQVARLLSHPRPVGIRRGPGQVNPASRQLDEEQDVEALEEDRVDGQEVALEDARCLLTKKLRPARLMAQWRRLDPRLPENRPDCARRDLDPEPDQLT